jgi:hypothetical protein
MKKILFFIVCATFLQGCYFKPLGDYPSNPKPDKCYAKCRKEDGTFDVWKEVICDKNLTTKKLIEIQTALRAAGFECGADVIDKTPTKDFKDGLLAYQKAKNLPQGAVDIDTMTALGVSMK